jgi:integrase
VVAPTPGVVAVARDQPGGRSERPHRPHQLGPRVFCRGRWWCADLRPWDGGRPTLRNPAARGWPARGNRTEDEETARRWAWAYVDELRDERKRTDLGLRARERPIGPLADEWTRWRELQRKARKTIEGGITSTGHLIDFVGERYPIEEIGSRLQGFFDSFLAAGYEPSTLDTMRRQLSSFFSWAGLEPNPARKARGNERRGTGIQLPHAPYTTGRSWTPDELLRIRASADKFGLRLAVELALGTGARQAELWALEGRDIEERQHVVHIRRQLEPRGTRKTKLKGKRSRKAVVLPFVWPHFEGAPAGLILHDGSGGIVKLRKSHDLLDAVLQDAGCAGTGVGWHSFRHTYAELFLLMGGSLDDLQLSLGHASIRTTQLIYGHLSSEDAAGRAAARIYGGQRRHLKVVS